MPVYPNIIPDWLKSENASVLDPAWKRGLRKVGSLIGADDPQSQIMQLGAPTPLVSIFKDKAARLASTDTFRKAARGLPNRITLALDEFAGKYPRVAAHMRPIPSGPLKSAPAAAAWVETPYKGTTLASRPRTIGFTPMGRTVELSDARQHVFHEGTHVAQGLGNKDFGNLYDYAEDMVGYEKNPFEVSARYEGGARIDRPQNAIKALRELALQTGQSLSEEGPIPAASKILSILEERTKKGWAPPLKPPRLHPKPKK